MGVKVFVSSSTGDMKVRPASRFCWIHQMLSEVSDPRTLQTLQNQQRILTILRSLEVDFVQVSKIAKSHKYTFYPCANCFIYLLQFCQFSFCHRLISLLLVRRAKESLCERKQRFSKLTSMNLSLGNCSTIP